MYERTCFQLKENLKILFYFSFALKSQNSKSEQGQNDLSINRIKPHQLLKNLVFRIIAYKGEGADKKGLLILDPNSNERLSFLRCIEVKQLLLSLKIKASLSEAPSTLFQN